MSGASAASGERALVLVGPMGAGKTSLGRRVARALGLPFADTDAEIVKEHGPIADIFAASGEERFRELERAAVRSAVSAGGVVALGGGAVLAAETRALLGRHLVVLLTVDEATIGARIRGSKRPLLNGGDPVAEWTRIAAEREPLYREVADAVFDTSHGPTQTTVERIVDWVRSQTEAPTAASEEAR